jgi:hypothetical protein
MLTFSWCKGGWGGVEAHDYYLCEALMAQRELCSGGLGVGLVGLMPASGYIPWAGSYTANENVQEPAQKSSSIAL